MCTGQSVFEGVRRETRAYLPSVVQIGFHGYDSTRGQSLVSDYNHLLMQLIRCFEPRGTSVENVLAITDIGYLKANSYLFIIYSLINLRHLNTYP